MWFRCGLVEIQVRDNSVILYFLKNNNTFFQLSLNLSLNLSLKYI
jgi:hypothetical protein